MAELTEDARIREHVRQRYARAAVAMKPVEEGNCGCASGDDRCCGASVEPGDGTDRGVFGAALYDEVTRASGAAQAVELSLGCGMPTAGADLRPGDVVLGLGSGAGADVIISARRVGPTGRAIGLDMTDEMLELARASAIAADVANVEFLKGYIEEVPLPDASVDVVISNCVINLAADKRLVLREAARVLRPGGRFAVSDVIADDDMDDATRADVAQWAGCIAGALTRAEYESALSGAGFTDILIEETHRVHASAASATVRARRPR